MKKIYTLLFVTIITVSYGQNRYSRVTSGPTFKARTLNEAMVVPMYSRQEYNKNQKILYNLQSYVMDLKTQVKGDENIDYLDKLHKFLEYMETVDLASSGEVLQGVNRLLKKFVYEYNQEIKNNSINQKYNSR